MLRGALAISMLMAGGCVAAATADAASQPPTYASEAEAKKACPHDIVVWLNTKSRYYHYKGQPWYGTTDVGASSARRKRIWPATCRGIFRSPDSNKTGKSSGIPGQQ